MSQLPDWQSLSLQEQIAQTIVVRASGYLFDCQIRYPAWEAPNAQLRQWLEELNLGGVILLGGSSIELKTRSQQLQSWVKIPLLLAADIEEGVGQRFPGGTWFPPPMALSEIYHRDPDLALRYATEMGKVTAREALAVGINWLLAPVVDVNNNPNNPVINIRAFGDTPQTVAALAGAFIAGAKPFPILTTAKHFPGHGDTTTDSHLDLPTLDHSDSRLAAIELLPFQRAIASGVDSVMTAHLLIQSWDRQRPATLSYPVLTGKLRHQLGFEGLVVSDALIMGGIAKFASPEEVAVMAIEAGSDILLMPENPEVAISSIYNAVRSGRISAERIGYSLERIWQAKKKVLQKNRHQFDISQLSTVSSKNTVEAILKNSQRCGGNIPLKPQKSENSRNLIVVDNVLNCPFLDLHTPAVTVPQQFGYQQQIVDSNTLDLILFDRGRQSQAGDTSGRRRLARRALASPDFESWGTADSRLTLLQVFIRGNPFRGTAGLTSKAKHLYQQLLLTGRVEGLIVYGSPYVLAWLSEHLPQNLPWVFTYGQMPSAQAIALSTIFAVEVEDRAQAPFFQPESRSSNFGF